MAVITPQTDVYLLKVPLEINDINQLTFANATAQYNYFSSLPKLTVDNFTYQRKDGTIRFPAHYDDLVSYNYVMYRNDAYSNKWFYAYIIGMEYKSDNSTDILIKTDTWQTWQFALSFKPCLIDREHVNDDTVGTHTLPEGLELGEMVTNNMMSNFGGASDWCTVVEVSMIENAGESQSLSYHWASGSHDSTPRLNSIDRGSIPLVLGMIEGVGNTPSHITNIYDKAGLGEAILNVYMLPKSLIGSYNEISITATVGSSTTTASGIVVPASKDGTYDMGTFNFSRPSSLANYIPDNKKLLTYPYCYFNISNNAGTSIPYHYEDFYGDIQFKVEGTFGVSGDTKALPVNYKRLSSSDNAVDFSISGAKYPVGSWQSDSYTNWLTQNAVNLETQWKTTIASGLANMAVGGYEGYSGAQQANKKLAPADKLNPMSFGAIGVVSGAIQLGGDLISVAQQQHLAKTQANMVPDQVHGNLGAGDFVWAKYKSPFTFMPMCIKPEYARCIDSFFSQFGYKCNRVKTPNVNGRRNWNYVKTVGCYIAGDIPQEDMQEIKAMFDRGVTFWHNPATFMDYSQNNDII